jgi:hypothetical protein
MLTFYPNILKSYYSYLYDSFTLNYNLADIDSLSADRFGIYEKAIEFFMKYLFFGRNEYRRSDC